ncbi:MAG: thiamine-phosphate pyrophosphorylase [Solirubrobacteraceae bacterium]|nr:thiamine-phosphate pyrophosphorylase [Solirubrobacteraceae bacterium]
MMGLMDGSERRERLGAARLYLVTGARPGGRPLAEVLAPALRGGVDLVQVREKDGTDDEILFAAAEARALCDAAGALLIVNDRPDLAVAAGADGVHVGQDDMAVADARAVVGSQMLVGLSTHAPEEIDAADADYIGVGPVHTTPTKPGRLAVGLHLVRHAAAHATLPWFAIGGIDPASIGPVVEAGARRIAVVRAITEARDPELAAHALRSALPQEAAHGHA